MGDYGIKVAIEEKNALTSFNPRDFLIWSKYKDFKILKKGKGSLLIPNGSTSARKQIAHGMGYSPAYYFWVDMDNNGKYWMVGSNPGSTSGSTPHNTSEPESNKTNISFLGTRDGTSGNENMPFAYAIFDQRAVDTYGGSDTPIGYQKADYGIKAAIPGVNVLKAKIYELVINSNCELLNYHSTRTIGLNWNNSANGSSRITIVHGLNYVPMFLAWGNHGSAAGTPFDKDNLIPVGRSPQPFTASAWANTYEVGIEITWAGGGSASGTFNCRVVIFENDMLS